MVHPKIASCDLDIRLFKIGTCHFLLLTLHDDDVVHKELDVLENCQWCLPKEVSIEDVTVFQIRQAGSSFVKSYLRGGTIDTVTKALIKVDIYGHIFDMFDDGLKQKCLQQFLQ